MLRLPNLKKASQLDLSSTDSFWNEMLEKTLNISTWPIYVIDLDGTFLPINSVNYWYNYWFGWLVVYNYW